MTIKVQFQDYNLEMFYRECWLDPRLNYDQSKFRNKTEIALHESYANFLWHPDTFIPNAIASKNPRKQSISHRSLLRLQANGEVLYSRRISVLAECSMDLSLVCINLSHKSIKIDIKDLYLSRFSFHLTHKSVNSGSRVMDTQTIRYLMFGREEPRRHWNSIR